MGEANPTGAARRVPHSVWRSIARNSSSCCMRVTFLYGDAAAARGELPPQLPVIGKETQMRITYLEPATRRAALTALILVGGLALTQRAHATQQRDFLVGPVSLGPGDV